ncbi:MAG TPA: ABC transporter permease, partial [Rhodocyclaceae bacterium]|nr:ABC transporter permease [Rhodocyclaceae bacterium]
MNPASIQVTQREDGGSHIALSGPWTLAAISRQGADFLARLAKLGADPAATWDGLAIDALDSAGAMLLWRTWGNGLPELLLARPEHLRVFERIEAAQKGPTPARVPASPLEWLITVGLAALALRRQWQDFVAVLGRVALDAGHLLRHPADLPKREISANVYKSGVRAMPVNALVGFLIGVVLSYLSALQLRQFGADIFIVNILGLGIVRELGPVLVAVLVAGRSGSAMTAQLGVMRVTEEIDALSTMGVSRSLRLVFPKVAALAVAMPLLVLWTTAIALVGGMVSAQ